MKRDPDLNVACTASVYGSGATITRTIFTFDIDSEQMREALLRDAVLQHGGAWDEIWVCAFPAPCLPWEDMTP